MDRPEAGLKPSLSYRFAHGSAKTTGDVALGFFVLRVVEHRGGVREVLEVAGLAHSLQVEEGGVVGDTGGLLHVVGHDQDRKSTRLNSSHRL